MTAPLLVAQLRICADCAAASPNGHTYLNEAARPMLQQAADEIERLWAVLESLTKDPPATLAREPDEDWEVIVKMRAIAKAALAPATTGRQT